MPRRKKGNEADGASQEAQDARSRRELIGGAGALAAAAALGGVGAAAAEGAAAAGRDRGTRARRRKRCGPWRGATAGSSGAG